MNKSVRSTTAMWVFVSVSWALMIGAIVLSYFVIQRFGPPQLLTPYPMKAIEAKPKAKEWLEAIKKHKLVLKIEPVVVNIKHLQLGRVKVKMFDEDFVCVFKQRLSIPNLDNELAVVWTGVVENQPGSSVTITCTENDMFASIRLIERAFEIWPAIPDWFGQDSSLHILWEVKHD